MEVNQPKYVLDTEVIAKVGEAYYMGTVVGAQNTDGTWLYYVCNNTATNTTMSVPEANITHSF